MPNELVTRASYEDNDVNILYDWELREMSIKPNSKGVHSIFLLNRDGERFKGRKGLISLFLHIKGKARVKIMNKLASICSDSDYEVKEILRNLRLKDLIIPKRFIFFEDKEFILEITNSNRKPVIIDGEETGYAYKGKTLKAYKIKINYYRVREPLITYLKKKYNDMESVSILLKLFEKEGNTDSIEEYCEKKAKELLNTDLSGYVDEFNKKFEKGS